MIPILSGNVASAIGGAYEVANSCRFNDGDSAYMNKTFGTPTNADIWTFSCWVKRSAIGTSYFDIFDAYTDSNNYAQISFHPDNYLFYYDYQGGAVKASLSTNRLFRDTSAWLNIIIATDTTQSTAANRIKLYVNGTQYTWDNATTYPDQNQDTFINKASTAHYIGTYSAGNYFDGYLAETVFIDGSQLAASSFGEFDEDSPRIWKPKNVSGLTFGTNGFYLDFEDSSNLGNDANGGTDWSETNLAATDQATDTPTNNFATMNPLVKGNTASTFSEGNLKVAAGGGWGHAVGNIGVAHGKWYWEIDEITASNNAFFGICNENNIGHLDNDSTPYSEAGLMLWFYDGRRTIDGTDSEGEYSGWGTTHGFALDLDSSPRTIKFYKDGSLEATENLTSNFPAGEFVFPIFMGSASSNTASVEFNFGNPVTALASGNNDANGYGSFEFSPPSGYIAICSKNLGSDGG
jgi:hypothetical protein